ncbi:MAG: transcription termination factor NusA [Proteocatella sp.]
MNADFITALNQIEAEKGISKDVLIEAVENALVNAYKKNFGATNNARVVVNRETGDIRVYTSKTVVNKREIDLLDGEISLEGAQEINMTYEVGDIVEEEVTPRNFGRVAAQTARQMVVQKIKEASRDIVFDEFSLKETEIMVGEIVRKVNGPQRPNVLINLSIRGKNNLLITTEAMLPSQEQMSTEDYELNDRITVYLLEIKKQNGVPQLQVSRNNPGLVKRLFEREVPEISEGIVQIKSISREAGSRTKMAVWSSDPSIDPIGSCVGTKGQRVANIVDELRGEKIDIIVYSEDPVEYISSALSPAKVISVEVNLEEKTARVVVPDYQLSLAIGKEGQNARLAAKLTGWKIDIKSETQAELINEGIFAELMKEETLKVEENLGKEAEAEAEAVLGEIPTDPKIEE